MSETNRSWSPIFLFRKCSSYNSTL